jgi:hypothetical protein
VQVRPRVALSAPPGWAPRVGGRTALLALVVCLSTGCGDGGSLPEPGPGEPGPERSGGDSLLDAEPIMVALRLHFHREEELVAVGRSVWFPTQGTELGAASERVLTAALEALLMGPTAEEQERGIHSFFSAETEDLLAEVVVEDRRAVVDLRDFRDRIPNASSSAGSIAFLAELTNTVFANSLVDEVEFQMEGSCEAFWAFLQQACTVVRRPAEV